MTSLIEWWEQMGAPDDPDDIEWLLPKIITQPQKTTTQPACSKTSNALDPKDAKTLDELQTMVEELDGGTLKKNAHSVVFADGTPKGVLIVGEAPGADEDRIGRPFVGRSGKLLDKMLAAIGLFREQNVRITNLLPWRPPGNRNPTDAEIALCAPFLRRHIALAEPGLIITAGNFATRFLLAPPAGIMTMRGKILTYQHDDVGPIPAIPILHPAYLLRRPAEKARAWRDMLVIEDVARQNGIALHPKLHDQSRKTQ